MNALLHFAKLPVTHMAESSNQTLATLAHHLTKTIRAGLTIGLVPGEAKREKSRCKLDGDQVRLRSLLFAPMSLFPTSNGRVEQRSQTAKVFQEAQLSLINVAYVTVTIALVWIVLVPQTEVQN